MPIDTSIAITIGGVNVSDEGATETFGFDGKEATRILRCDWNDRGTLYAYLAGGSQQIGTANVYASGQPYPDDPRLLVWNIKTKGDGTMSVGPNGMAAYQYAVLTVLYKVPLHNYADPLLIGTEELDFASTAIALDQGTSVFKWTSGPNNTKDLPPSAIPAVNFTTVCFTKERYRVPTLPEATIEALIDMTNNATMFGAAAGTLVFRGARSRREIVISGERNWAIGYAFEFNRHGWNSLPDGANGWQTFAYKSDGTLLFPQADLGQLFTT